MKGKRIHVEITKERGAQLGNFSFGGGGVVGGRGAAQSPNIRNVLYIYVPLMILVPNI